MNKIDWKSRFKSPMFWFNTVLSIVTPIFVYYKVSKDDFTTWNSVFSLVLDAIKNPYVLGLSLVSLWNNVTNPIAKSITNKE